MTEEGRQRRREERRKNCKPGVAYVSSDYVLPTPDEEDEFWIPSYYYQIARTLGLKRYGHPELETLITYSVERGGYSLLTYLARLVREGASFAAGMRVEIPDRYPGWVLCTVEFRESQDAYGPCLRAVVLGLEEEYQAPPSKEAERWLMAHGPLCDPAERL